MKKFFIAGIFASAVLIFANCGPSKKLAETPPPPMTFETNVSMLLAEKCSPCHMPAKGGNKRPYDNFANVKSDIDEILRRIQLNPGERGFMPMRSATKLSDSTINVIKQWKADGLLEK